MSTEFTPEFIAAQRALLEEFYPREEREFLLSLKLWTGYTSALDEIERLQKELDELKKETEDYLMSKKINRMLGLEDFPFEITERSAVGEPIEGTEVTLEFIKKTRAIISDMADGASSIAAAFTTTIHEIEKYARAVDERNAMIEKYEQDLDELHDRIKELEEGMDELQCRIDDKNASQESQ
jgi:uncharacterized coiled-coil DUF342 family protein